MTATDAVSAAIIATQDPAVLQQHDPQSSRRRGPIAIRRCSHRLNDYTATVVGMVRDDVPFNTLLSADLVYIADSAVRRAGLLAHEQRHV